MYVVMWLDTVSKVVSRKEFTSKNEAKTFIGGLQHYYKWLFLSDTRAQKEGK